MRRLVIYCLVPQSLDAELLDDLRAHFSSNDAVQVIPNRRLRDRRASARSGRPSRSYEEDRRGGSDRRRGVLPRTVPALPPKLAARAQGITFVQRMLPVSSELHDLGTEEIVERVRRGDAEAPTELYWRLYERIHSRLCVLGSSPEAADRIAPSAFGRVLDALAAQLDRPFEALVYEAVDATATPAPAAREDGAPVVPQGLAVSGAKLDEPVEFAERDPAWFGRAQAERARLMKATGEHLVALEHIGATSVPSIAARPVLDFILGTPARREPVEVKAALLDLGYERCGSAGVKGRTYYRQRGVLKSDLHVVHYGSDLWRDAVGLRDYLRQNPNEAQRWAAVRREAARAGGHSLMRYASLRAAALEGLAARAAESSQGAA